MWPRNSHTWDTFQFVSLKKCLSRAKISRHRPPKPLELAEQKIKSRELKFLTKRRGMTKAFRISSCFRLTNASIARSSSAKNRRIGVSWTDTDPNHGTSKAGPYLCVEENSIKAAHKNDLRAHAAFPGILFIRAKPRTHEPTNGFEFPKLGTQPLYSQLKVN